MEVQADIDAELLAELDRVARAQKMTRCTAVQEAIATWLSQARREDVLRELIGMEFDQPYQPESDLCRKGA